MDILRQAPPLPDRSAALDVLRGAAIVGVVAVHTLGPASGTIPPLLRSLVANGARGVQLFIVVSVVLALSSLERRASAGSPVRRYWIDRWLRLAPLFYLALAATLVRDAAWPRVWPAGSPSVDAANVAAHLAFAHALSPWWVNSVMGVEWALGLLALFYLAAPFVVRAVRDLRAAALLFGVTAVLVPLAVGWLGAHVPAEDAALWRDWLGITVAQLPVLAAGVLAWHGDRALAGQPGEPRVRAALLAAGAASLVVLCAGYPALPSAVRLVATGAACAALVVGVMGRRAGSEAQGVGRPLAALGVASYGIYLFHMLLLQAAVAALPLVPMIRDGIAVRVALLPFVLTASAAVAVLLQRSVERPFVEWGRSLLTPVPEARPGS